MKIAHRIKDETGSFWVTLDHPVKRRFQWELWLVGAFSAYLAVHIIVFITRG